MIFGSISVTASVQYVLRYQQSFGKSQPFHQFCLQVHMCTSLSVFLLVTMVTLQIVWDDFPKQLVKNTSCYVTLTSVFIFCVGIFICVITPWIPSKSHSNLQDLPNRSNQCILLVLFLFCWRLVSSQSGINKQQE